MRRFAPVLLAVLLLFSFPITAYAADGDDGGLLGGLVDGFLDGLKSLFIPDEEFFKDFNDEIQKAIDKKTGGLATTFKTITDNFKGLSDAHAINNSLKLTMPDNSLYPGYKGVSVNVLGGIDGFASWFRGLFSAFLVVVTVIMCYRKTVALFKGD